ncbi:MAG: type II toxin-antitoxin system prevent-host-death family antitoxin [Rhizobiaceae bacterium]|nr:type II toxin-antitoxin system prevent-host-death family antitoxin [Rhizobiaceae bacterium]MCC0043794.1 type II toxin-antitoxin system prevent-host-death family antitoxin [Brucellaceae bacterium]
MNSMTASDAKNKFGQLLELARSGPVRIQKQGRDVAIVLSPDEFRRIAEAAGSSVNPLVEKLHAESAERWAKVYEALAK